MAMKAELNVEGEIIEAVIDTGAAMNVITNKLRRKLGVPIRHASRERCTLANGEVIASLGMIDIGIRMDEEIIIPIEVQVIDSIGEELIIGNETLSDLDTEINFEREELVWQYEGETLHVPIRYVREEEQFEESDCEREEEVDDENYDYEMGEQMELYTIIKRQEEEEEAKEIVFAS
jgi:predicted aspartyl protease